MLDCMHIYIFTYARNNIFAVISEKFPYDIKADWQATSPSTFAPQIFKVPSANFRMLDYAYMFARAT